MPRPSPAAAARHPHLADPLPAGWVRVDLHSHTMWSGDSTTTPDEIEAAVVEAGLDVVCITDHNAIKGALDLGDRLPCRVIVGEELKTQAGEIIGLFLTERIVAGTPPVEAAQAIRAQGGVVYVPHPFDPMRRNLAEAPLRDLAGRGLIDAVEVINAKTSLASL
ncbi:MAG TPA: PHP domain-containing protein, partial [Ilumatobacteraceae bacterium]|nr:PHP domain-containing protein [Ilumatobacteraceae bacterium]